MPPQREKPDRRPAVQNSSADGAVGDGKGKENNFFRPSSCTNEEKIHDPNDNLAAHVGGGR